MRAGGVSAKSQGAGGSFGFGKGAYYTLSPIKTIVVSTRDNDNNVFFEGSTILTTHKNATNQKLTAYGYYDNNNGEPTQNNDDIPEVFQRTKIGTDVNIIGLWKEDDRKKLMIKSVLNNFWLAIYHKKLVVQVDDVTISENNIEQIIDQYFEGEFESGKADEIESWNPKAYFKAVKYAGNHDQYKVFEDELNTIGQVKLYVYLEKGLPNRTAYFRKPKMVVFKRTNGKVKGYVAVFVCENEKGNEMLRLMENPAHNEWKEENYPKNEGDIDTNARRGRIEISDFINRTLESLAKIKTGNKIAFVGLEEYLSIPEDLLEKDEEYDFEGQSTSNVSGQSSNENTEDETGMLTSDKTEPVTIKPTVKTQQSEAKGETNIEVTEEGEETITVGGENESEGGDAPPSDLGDNVNTGNRTDESPNKSRTVIKVRLRVAAQTENEVLFHHLIVNSDNEIENAELELLVSGDNDRDDSISIISSDKGTVSKNTIKNLKLDIGVTKIKIRFADNIKHSVKLKAYEIQ